MGARKEQQRKGDNIFSRHADVKLLAVVGHSMGGDAAAVSAGASQLDELKAVVAMNPSCNFDAIPVGEAVSVPIMYTTGASDVVVLPEVVYAVFEATQHKPKVLANQLQASHFEPMNICVPTLFPTVTTCATIDIWVSYFLMCHVRSNSEACDLIYGTKHGSLCHGGSAGPMFPGGCQAIKA